MNMGEHLVDVHWGESKNVLMRKEKVTLQDTRVHVSLCVRNFMCWDVVSSSLNR